MALDLESLVVAVIVAVATGYAVWTLMPGTWRRALQRRLTGRNPVGAGEAGGACGGCSGGCTPPPQRSASAAAEGPVVRPITLHRKPRH